MDYYLKPLSYSGIPIKLNDFMTLGSDKDCHIPVPSVDVSERHLRFEFKGPHLFIKDLRSRSGSLLNGESVTESQISINDIITVGDLEFQIIELKDKSNFSLTSKNKDWNDQLGQLVYGSKTDFPILMLGSSGTGKEVLARAIHESSSRKDGPMVSVNCSALTETLVESELFGHVKGSFTGAINDRKGAFEAARGGTLFLDEIGDLPLSMQAKLLRALENCEIRPVGCDRTIHTDVRILAATHKNLKENIQQGKFRSDLFYRLNVIAINLPDLKDRLEDFNTILGDFCRTYRVRFSHAATEKLKEHSWAGNIRELRNLVIRASALCPNELITESHLEKLLEPGTPPEYWSMPENGVGRWPVIKEIERQMIIKRLEANKGNQKLTAKDLGIPKSTLHDRIKNYEIDLDHLKLKTS